MMISENMKNKEETANKFGCEFCGRSFQRETTIAKHICEYKQRWMNKDMKGNRLGLQAWLQFYDKNTPTKKKRTYEDFMKSAYYSAFVKFGMYCADINALNVSRFVDWLLDNQIKIDTWCSDKNYSRFLVEYLRAEDPLDALARSIETTINLAEEQGIYSKDILRYGNSNKICVAVTNGKISPWMLYHSESGTRFLDTLDNTQVKMIIDYINPELWAIKFKRDPENVRQVKELLSAAGF